MLNKIIGFFFVVLLIIVVGACSSNQSTLPIASGSSNFEGAETKRNATGFGSVLFNDQETGYDIVDGYAVIEGDIIIGTAEEVEAAALSPQAVYRTNESLWPADKIFYEISSGFSSSQESDIEDAIEHFDNSTDMTLIERTSETNYVDFESSSVCNSWVGMKGGRQVINLSSSCGYGSIIHEIGHAAGLWHEQSRGDRDDEITRSS